MRKRKKTKTKQNYTKQIKEEIGESITFFPKPLIP